MFSHLLLAQSVPCSRLSHRSDCYCTVCTPASIGAFDKRTIIDLSGDVIKEIAQKYENVQKVVGDMMRGAMIETSESVPCSRLSHRSDCYCTVCTPASCSTSATSSPEYFAILSTDNSLSLSILRAVSFFVSFIPWLMAIRLFEYDAQIALDEGEVTEETLTVTFPNTAVLYLRNFKRRRTK